MTLLDAARDAAQRLRTLPSGASVELVATATADGVAASAVLARALGRAGRPFHARFADPLEPAPAPGEDSLPPEAVLLLGLAHAVPGHRLRGTRWTLAIDHEAPAAAAPSGVQALNPVLLGQSASSASTSTTAFALALAIDERNADLAPVALCGLGAFPASGAPGTWNERVAADAKRSTELADRAGLALEEWPLLDALAHGPAPFRGLLEPGYDAAAAFLGRVGLPAEATPSELGPRERELLASHLALLHLRGPKPPQVLARLFGPDPWVPALGGLSLARLNRLLEAAAWQGEAGIGLGFLLGDTSARPELETLLAAFYAATRPLLRTLALPATVARPGLKLWNVGTLAGARVLASPPVALSLDGTRVTLTAHTSQGTLHLFAARPMDPGSSTPALGPLLHDAAAEAGGRGAGTRHRAAAQIPPDRLDGFLEALGTRLVPPGQEVVQH